MCFLELGDGAQPPQSALISVVMDVCVFSDRNGIVFLRLKKSPSLRSFNLKTAFLILRRRTEYPKRLGIRDDGESDVDSADGDSVVSWDGHVDGQSDVFSVYEDNEGLPKGLCGRRWYPCVNGLEWGTIQIWQN